MAKKYAFDESGRREYHQIRKRVLGGGTRSQTKVYKKWERTSSGGGGAALAGSIGMVFGDIPANDDANWADMSGSVSLDWTVQPGQSGPLAEDDGTEWDETSGVLLYDWARMTTVKEDYIAAEYDTDFDTMTPVVEEATSGVRWAWRRAVNRSKTDIRASTAEPIMVAGHQQTLRQGGAVYRWFVITDVMDFRALPGFAVGTAPVGADDADLQIPYHSGGNTDFELNSEDCAGA